ncbi:MAG: DUF4352 domain-containing protein [Coriobacteriaceae bacterium]|nr:DUF4352 domain-containing protein [Coriobacteriaceae bacterium]
MKVSKIMRFARRGMGVFAAGAFALTLVGCGGSPSVKGSVPAEQEAPQKEQKTTDLAAGTAVDMGNGMTVSVDSIEPSVAGASNTYVKISVTYKNEGDDTVSFNPFDWKGEDANGAQEDHTYFAGPDFSSDDAELNSGNLAAGGTKSGTLYFKEGTTKILFTGNIFSKDVQASWTVA